MAIQHSTNSSSLGDLLERILDKGVVVAGDIKISLADVELLNIKIRLLVASVDKAREMGIDWWEHDPYLSSRNRSAQTLETKKEPAGLIERPVQEHQVQPPAESVTSNSVKVRRP